ncbi:MAG: acyltransferase family protein [Oscillospiraceae bacterium]|nr:acyltransferase family protein [Oscillospiraceae bacterium]
MEKSSTDNSGTRSSNMELLRIAAMYMIVTFHGVVNSGVESAAFTPGKVASMFYGIGGNLGVDLFFLISGYFLVRTDFRLYSIVKILLRVMFYSVTIYLVCCAFGIVEFDIATFGLQFYTTIRMRYWFASIYVGILLIFPILGAGFKTLSQRAFILFLSAQGFLFIILPTFFNRMLYQGELPWALFVCSVGAYIRLYGLPLLDKKYLSLLLAAFATGFIFFYSVKHAVLADFDESEKELAMFFRGKNTLPVFLAALGLFMFFKNLSVKNNRFINQVSSTTFGVYLIHENRILRDMLWRFFFDENYLIFTWRFWYIAPAVGAIVFCACAAIDVLREKTIGKLYGNYVKPLCEKAQLLIGL